MLDVELIATNVGFGCANSLARGLPALREYQSAGIPSRFQYIVSSNQRGSRSERTKVACLAGTVAVDREFILKRAWTRLVRGSGIPPP